MTTLTPLCQEFHRLKKVLETPLDSVGSYSRAGLIQAQNAAKEQLPRVRRQYAAALVPTVAGFVIPGPFNGHKHGRFVSLLETEGDVKPVVLSAAELYATAAEAVLKAVPSTGTWGQQQVTALQTHMFTEARRLGIRTWQPRFETPPGVRPDHVVTARALEAAPLVRSYVRHANGDALNLAYLLDKLLDECLRRAWDGEVLPLVLTETDEAETALGQLFGRGHLVLPPAMWEGVSRKQIDGEFVRRRYEELAAAVEAAKK